MTVWFNSLRRLPPSKETLNRLNHIVLYNRLIVLEEKTSYALKPKSLVETRLERELKISTLRGMDHISTLSSKVMVQLRRLFSSLKKFGLLKVKVSP